MAHAMNRGEVVNKCFCMMPSVATWLMPPAAVSERIAVNGKNNGDLMVSLNTGEWKEVMVPFLEDFEQILLQCASSWFHKELAATWIEFSIELKKTSPKQRLGIRTWDFKCSWEVTHIYAGGLVDLYNNAAEEMQKVKEGDRIIEVNGVNTCDSYEEIVHKAQELHFLIKRKETPQAQEEFCHGEVARLILTNEVDEYFEDPHAETALDISVLITPLHYAARVGNAVMTSLLLQLGANVNSHIVLAYDGSGSERENTEQASYFDVGYVTPLSLALLFGHMGVVSMLQCCGGKVKEHYCSVPFNHALGPVVAFTYAPVPRLYYQVMYPKGHEHMFKKPFNY